ncbi:hypothetical protein K7432_011051 [Basidiobolus ranarum]|uniref:RRM domain-containing protein n=1 Tax=Basidiobolus ranarum TaxID=34480 RepID=A0ABR2VUK9_9FUNG
MITVLRFVLEHKIARNYFQYILFHSRDLPIPIFLFFLPKVSNISSLVSETILKKVFEFLGEVVSFRLYPSVKDGLQECIVEFKESSSALTALHLTGTTLGEESLVVTKCFIEESTVPICTPTIVNNTVNTPSTPTYDATKVEEITRTVYVGNINTNITEAELIKFFSTCGPVIYVKMAGDAAQPTRFAFLEFSNIPAAQMALNMNGVLLGERPLKINHSKNAINKVIKKPVSQETMDTMRLVHEAQLRITTQYTNGSTVTLKSPTTETPKTLLLTNTKDKSTSSTSSNSRELRSSSPSQKSRSQIESRSRPRSPRSRSRERDEKRSRRHTSRDRHNHRSSEHRRSSHRRDRSYERQSREKGRSRNKDKTSDRSRSPRRYSDRHRRDKSRERARRSGR